MDAYKNYNTAQTSSEDPRAIEYRLLGQVTAALIGANENPKDVKRRVEAVLWNQKVWAAFREDLVDPGNKLPLELRGQLISLSIFVERQTFELLDLEKQPDFEPLIDINKNIMEGLAAQLENSRKAVNQQPPADGDALTGTTA